MSGRPPNHWDSMLAWLSTESNHKWSNVKARCMRLSAIAPPRRELTPYGHAMRWIDPLIRLGHAEYDPSRRTLNAISPGLIFSSSLGKAICYGYWDPIRLSNLRRNEFRPLRHDPKHGPTCRAFHAERQHLVAFAEKENVWLADDPGVDVLRRMPSLSHALHDLEPSPIVSKGSWERYEFRSTLYGEWRNSSQLPVERGLYRHRDGKLQQIFIGEDLRSYKLETRDQKIAAKWSCYKACSAWIYNPKTWQLLIPHGTPELPVLVSRGLTTKSARMATRVAFDKSRWWQYVAVDQLQAEHAARIMQQKLLVRNTSNV